jgi:hypothetical protein
VIAIAVGGTAENGRAVSQYQLETSGQLTAPESNASKFDRSSPGTDTTHWRTLYRAPDFSHSKTLHLIPPSNSRGMGFIRYPAPLKQSSAGWSRLVASRVNLKTALS